MGATKVYGDEEFIKALAIHEILQREVDDRLALDTAQEIQNNDKTQVVGETQENGEIYETVPRKRM